jgi:hypothetical protein
MTSTHHGTQLLLAEMGFHKPFAQSGVYLKSSQPPSQVARITGVSHLIQFQHAF